MVGGGTIAELLDHEMHRRCWTLGYLADLLGRLDSPGGVRPSVQVVWNWRSGRTTPSRTYQRLIARALDLSTNVIADACRLQTERKAGNDEDVDRRQFLHGVVVAGAGAAAGGPLWERLIHAVHRPEVDPMLSTALRAQADGFHRTEVSVSGGGLLDGLTTHLDQLGSTLSWPMGSALRRELISTTSESAALAGWVAWDLGDVTQASGFYRAAQDAAGEANAPGLVACVAEYQSCAAAGLGDSRGAIRLLHQGRAAVGRAALPVTLVWLLAREAEGQAALGNADMAVRLISDALDGWHRRPDGHNEGAWVEFIDDARIAGYAVNAYAAASRFDEAASAAEWLLSTLRDDTPKRRAISYAAVAEMHVRRGDLASAYDFAMRSLGLFATCAPRMASDRLHAMRPLLADFGNAPEASRLDELLLTV